MQLQSELPQAFPPFLEEPLGIGTVLKPQNTIVSITDHADFPGGPMLPPVLYPKIENVMQINVREQRRNHSAYTKGNFDRPATPILCFEADPKESECCGEW